MLDSARDQLSNHLYDDHRVVTDRAVDNHVKICAVNWSRLPMGRI